MMSSKASKGAIVAAVVVSMALAGCAGPGAPGSVGSTVAGGARGCGFQQTVQTNNTATGALIGGLAGAAIGAATGQSHGKRALIGAAGGALVGGAIGAYMDQQEQALRGQLAGSGIQMARSGDVIILTLPEGITFQTGKSNLSTGAQRSLDRVAPTLVRFEKTTVGVCGHTDSTGSRATNVQLSQDRAFAVANYLTSRGVPPQRISTRGFADDMPVAGNDTTAGRAQNRRVEIVLQPISQG
ncbi:outer membrane protein OmpA-like peptidoglycan-associated protein [Plasticicumulans lactativorans]|uniref:Outer membrane protein OmpA-like peptidoglycan-associated protein n=1 Tax=Plasticicumulans lactativorans TaxID=1133106 RepID=A0A4R2L0U1_9GAMM|nr:OmpA family protein [Plasticicumulans lactativorans]TCO77316.1 outer membrane protein OmpA-like peptidoglycan-associated protein [Plasticicumulans lactativorans]